MPNIVYDVKLDFKDVLLRPKRSTLKSRADVDLYREITFRNSKQTYNGIPIMASNMDTVGTFEMAKTLAKVRSSSSDMIMTGVRQDTIFWKVYLPRTFVILFPGKYLLQILTKTFSKQCNLDPFKH